MWKLTIEDDEGQQTSLELARDEYTVGRAEGNSICLTERNVSRSHAVLRRTHDGWQVEDLQSYNGTYVNGARVVDVVPLQSGDIVQLADYRIELLDEAAIEVAEVERRAAAAVLPPEQRRPARLIMVIGPQPGAEFPLVGERVIIGRAEEAQVSINHTSVSRNHAEMQVFGDGRWEIIDLGSANGMRINGVELKRGILDQGDALELGDVRLRFVGIGKFLRPMAHVMQQLPGLEAAAPPEALATSVQRSIGKIVGIAAVVCVLVVVAWVMIGANGTPAGTAETGSEAPMATNLQAAKELLAEASEVAEADIFRAHAMLARIPEESPIREEDGFKEIENRWADAVFEKVDQTKDVKEKRALLMEIQGNGAVDTERRQRAADMLLELGPDPDAPTPQPGPLVRRPTGQTPTPYDTPPPSTATKTETKTKTAPKAPGDTKYDENAQRRALEARVWSGNASEAEIRMLRAICSNQGDRACRNRAHQMLKQKQKQKDGAE
ncbi:MAG: FHA domain-containing protein [Deltaproteobacteria bacterium]|jgi:pSer/pThr/pTyr-binding forkhead associated (FHA) protein|nr:FHA domain-containing protein [Deltaproteobacteria bacterium]MBW2531155.1 FHA domain-containing protein [Deltaproteobacteria bacterium]